MVAGPGALRAPARAVPRPRAAGFVPAALPAVLLLASLPLLRPGVFGEQFALGGLVAALAAGVLALVRRTGHPTRPVPAATVLGSLLAAAYLWMLGHAVFTATPERVRDQFQDFALTVGAVTAGVIVLADPRVRRAVGRGLVLVLVVVAGLWVLTALWWAVAGVGAGQVGTVPVGTAGPQPVFFPGTISYATSSVFGVDVPRLTGIGRESGWMAMDFAAGWFLADAVGYRAVWVKVLLLAGLVGTLSTAGFGVFVVVLAVDVFLRPRGGIGLAGMVRQLVGVAALGAAALLAVDAPVLGLAAKESSNAASLDERTDATVAGLRALSASPWGGPGTEKQAGVNLVSDIAVNGLPFVVLVAAALLVPVLVVRRAEQAEQAGPAGPAGRSGAVALVVFLTLLTSQPAAASTWAFLLVAVALAADELTPAERAAPGAAVLSGLHRRCAGRRRLVDEGGTGP